MLTLLSKDEVKYFRCDAAPELYNLEKEKKQLPKIDSAAAQRWVANRAYRMGWTAKRFSDDYSQTGRHLSDRPLVERIGKKYQWLALNELMCRLGDNYWLDGEYGSVPKSYASPIDVGYHRDIDPTIIKPHSSHDLLTKAENLWAAQPEIHLENVSENDLPEWPFQEDPAAGLEGLIVREDEFGTKWVILYEHQSKTEKYAGDRGGDHGIRQQEFRFLLSAIVRKDEMNGIVNKLTSEQKLDIHDWNTHSTTDEAFLFEAPWRSTWPSSKWRSSGRAVPAGVGVASPVAGYCWESHLDASLPEGFCTHLPSPWLAQKLDFKPDITLAGNWHTSSGDPAFRTFSGDEGGVICLIQENILAQVLEDELRLLFLLIAERNAWPGGNNDNASWRRSEGVCWYNGKKVCYTTWKNDNGNGISAKLVKKIKIDRHVQF